MPVVELLWWRECPSWERAIDLVRAEMEAIGLDPGALRAREITTEAEAEREGFVGSPTVRVDGADVEPPSAERPGLTCRVYRRRDGRVSPLPDTRSVRDALAAALEGEKG